MPAITDVAIADPIVTRKVDSASPLTAAIARTKIAASTKSTDANVFRKVFMNWKLVKPLLGLS